MNTIKQHSAEAATVLRSAGLQIYPDVQRVYYDGQLLPIKGLTYRLLETLVLAQQRPVSAAEIAQKVWRTAYVSDETLAQRVSLLRKALGFLQTDIIESLRSEGYRWLAAVDIASNTADVAAPDTESPAPALQPGSRKAKYAYSALCVTVVVVLLYAVYVPPQPVVENSAQHSRDENPYPAGLSKAFEYARQNTASGNAIAVDLFKQYLNTAPQHVDARMGLAVSYIERVIKFNGNPQLLALAAEQIELLVDSKLAPWQLSGLKGYYFDALGDIEQAIFHYEQALQANSGAVNQIAASLAYLYVRKGRLYEALQLNLSVLNNQGGYTFLQIAEILYLTGLSEQSAGWVNTAYKFAPNDAFVAAQYAKDADARGDRPAAYQALNALKKFNATTAYSYITLATLFVKDEHWQQAASALAEADALEPDSLYSQSLRYWLIKLHHIAGTAQRPVTQSDTPVWPDWYVAKSVVEIADGNLSMAKTSLKQAIAEGFSDYQYLVSTPVFSDMMQHPEFAPVLQQLVHSVNTERTKISTINLPDPASLMQAE